MGKTLLQNFTGNSEANENTATVTGVTENKMLAELVQPRQEAVDQLLKKVLH